MEEEEVSHMAVSYEGTQCMYASMCNICNVVFGYGYVCVSPFRTILVRYSPCPSLKIPFIEVPEYTLPIQFSKVCRRNRKITARESHVLSQHWWVVWMLGLGWDDWHGQTPREISLGHGSD